ncbi:hypothetical protein D3C75_1096850 [compost metagenome]
MITQAITAFTNAFMQPFQVVAHEINAVVILNLAVLVETLFVFNAHAVLRNIAIWVAIIFTQVGENIVNPLLVNFPATIRVHFAARHFVGFKEPFRHKRAVRVNQ